MTIIGQQIAHCQEPTKETDMPELPESARMTEPQLQAAWGKRDFIPDRTRAVARAAENHGYRVAFQEQELVKLLAELRAFLIESECGHAEDDPARDDCPLHGMDVAFMMYERLHPEARS